jgi:hypothetical protein
MTRQFARTVTLQKPLKTVESKARQVHVFRPAGSIENGEDIFYFLSVIRSDPLRFSLLKQPSQSPMPEASNHDLRFTVP